MVFNLTVILLCPSTLPLPSPIRFSVLANSPLIACISCYSLIYYPTPVISCHFPVSSNTHMEMFGIPLFASQHLGHKNNPMMRLLHVVLFNVFKILFYNYNIFFQKCQIHFATLEQNSISRYQTNEVCYLNEAIFLIK